MLFSYLLVYYVTYNKKKNPKLLIFFQIDQMDKGAEFDNKTS